MVNRSLLAIAFSLQDFQHAVSYLPTSERWKAKVNPACQLPDKRRVY